MRCLTASVCVLFAPLRLCLLCLFFLIFYGRAQVERRRRRTTSKKTKKKNKNRENKRTEQKINKNTNITETNGHPLQMGQPEKRSAVNIMGAIRFQGSMCLCVTRLGYFMCNLVLFRCICLDRLDMHLNILIRTAVGREEREE